MCLWPSLEGVLPYTLPCMCTPMHPHTRMCVWVGEYTTHTHTYTHSHTHTHSLTYSHTHSHTHSHTYTHMQIQSRILIITKIPQGAPIARIKNRLDQLSDNCGGKVLKVDPDRGTARILYRSNELAIKWVSVYHNTQSPDHWNSFDHMYAKLWLQAYCIYAWYWLLEHALTIFLRYYGMLDTYVHFSKLSIAFLIQYSI